MALNSTALLPDGKGLFVYASIFGFEGVDRGMAEYHDTLGGYLLMILIVGGVLYALYMLAFEPEQVHDVNETLRTAPRR